MQGSTKMDGESTRSIQIGSCSSGGLGGPPWDSFSWCSTLRVLSIAFDIIVDTGGMVRWLKIPNIYFLLEIYITCFFAEVAKFLDRKC